jgi:hypothetical protein
MSLFGPPDIDKLSEKENVKGLINALGYIKTNKYESVLHRHSRGWAMNVP